MLPLIYIIYLILAGIVAGVFTGLLGVGGGFILTPVQFFILTAVGVETTTAIRGAIGTTLVVIFFSAISSTIAHHKKKVVIWKVVILLSITGIITAFIGGVVATHLPGEVVRIAFGIVAIIAAMRMLTPSLPESTDEEVAKRLPINNVLIYILLGLPIGFITGALGIGGGIVMVPIMKLVLGFPMHYAIATSTGVMVFTSIGGVAAYILRGLDIGGLPMYSLGYINLPQLILLTATTIPMTQIGVIAAHKLSGTYLKYIFGAIMFYVGLRMSGLLNIF